MSFKFIKRAFFKKDIKELFLQQKRAFLCYKRDTYSF